MTSSMCRPFNNQSKCENSKYYSFITHQKYEIEAVAISYFLKEIQKKLSVE